MVEFIIFTLWVIAGVVCIIFWTAIALLAFCKVSQVIFWVIELLNMDAMKAYGIVKRFVLSKIKRASQKASKVSEDKLYE